MSTKMISLIVALVGLLVAILSALLDVIGIGNPARFGYYQISGVVIGGLVFIVAITFYLRK